MMRCGRIYSMEIVNEGLFYQSMDETTESNEESVDFDQLKDRVRKLRFALI